MKQFKILVIAALACIGLTAQQAPAKAQPKAASQEPSKTCELAAKRYSPEAQLQCIAPSPMATGAQKALFGKIFKKLKFPLFREHCISCKAGKLCKLCVIGAKKKWCDSAGKPHVQCVG